MTPLWLSAPIKIKAEGLKKPRFGGVFVLMRLDRNAYNGRQIAHDAASRGR